MRKFALGMMLCLLVVARAGAAATVEEVLTKMEGAVKEVKTMEMDLKMKAPQMESTGHFKGEPATKKYNMTMDVKAMGADMKMNIVTDGKMTFTEMNMGGMIMVMKGTQEQMEKLGGWQSNQSPVD